MLPADMECGKPVLTSFCAKIRCHIIQKFICSLNQGLRSDTSYYISHFSYSCKMQCPLNLVLENCEYLWFYLTFWIAILDCDLKLHKLSIHTLVILEK